VCFGENVAGVTGVSNRTYFNDKKGNSRLKKGHARTAGFVWPSADTSGTEQDKSNVHARPEKRDSSIKSETKRIVCAAATEPPTAFRSAQLDATTDRPDYRSD
jgi:hypothetical protein